MLRWVRSSAVLLVALACLGAAGPEQDAGGLVFDPPVLDLGLVPQGASRAGAIRIRNAADGPRSITVAATSCSCTKVTWPAEPIQPGGSAEALITMTPPGSPGAVDERTVTFVVDGASRATIRVRATVGTPVAGVGGNGASGPAAAAAPVAAARPRFVRGDPTVFPGARVPFPALDVWVKGEARSAFEPGRTYVLEFFETTCGHCGEYAALVAELAREFGARGMEFVAVTGEDPATVRAWLAQPGKAGEVPYSVAADPDRSALALLQGGTFRSFNPRFFVLRDGEVLWFGHPKEARGPLEAIAAGTWDPASVRAEFVLESVAARAKNAIDAMARRCDASGDWSPMFALLDEVRAAIPERAAQYDTQRFVIMIGLAGMPDEGYALGRRIAAERSGDMVTLRSLARGALQSPYARRRDLDFGMECALAADRLAGGLDARAADTVALAWFSKGDRSQAVANGERAVRLEKDAKARRQYESALAKYRTAPTGPEPTREHSRSVDADAPAGSPGASGDALPADGH
jgi:thiol-disulfide isomerase/thioredoxin